MNEAFWKVVWKEREIAWFVSYNDALNFISIQSDIDAYDLGHV